MSEPRTARQIRDDVAAGRSSATEACEAALERIAHIDPSLNAFQTVAAERALDRARTLDRDHAALASLPLAGVPIALKDNLCTRGLTTTAGSRILDGYRPPYDATVVSRLERAGAVIVGKTRCDEFAMGSSTENCAYGPVKNPWALDRIPGGSSGGSAAAVAATMVPVALGSDTGGSVRQPAALCGVTGLKPTWGRVSRYGLIAFASSLDQIGPIARTVEDAALVLQAIAGPDPCDATAALAPVADYAAALEPAKGLRGRTIAVPRRLLEEGLDAGVRQAFDDAVEALKARGAKIIDVELPHNRHAIAIYYLIATAEASSNLARYDGVRYGVRAPLDPGDTLIAMYGRTREAGFGPEVKRRIMLGTYVLSAGYYDAYYLKAQQVRTLIRQDFERALASADVVALPTSPTPAFRSGERTADPLKMYLADVFTVSAPLAGLPAISIPCGFADGLPVGLQFVGRPFDEATIFGVAHAYERDTDWWKARPPVSG
ncbi:MAG TPA: Asp-tRNA(Asn)/Glu-tRNA(Gln) amidotransferase subunit GatA [Vicinamibacterales bacterium]|nr:Asp-tRNA(Asn)/Glu-tRNA(Gln) amidotransferase subunit GatA [Vicinamibacterales bacterium]